ncbi:MAG TPA: phosphate signaling complex protein PhoU [Syntrophales bacterium]|nr:phosphate signaling complex protein PhoU [Syntrophales bacterium]HOM07663.1 phosphate signaling complex protein PhoU [Syntrophales bacterium]
MEERRHTSRAYERELQEVKENLLYLGALTEKAINRGIQALLERNSELAREVIEGDGAIDRLDREIEERCIRLLALRQPAARDLRFITTAIKINGHLERIGDMVVKICEKVLLLNEEPQLKPYIDLPRMAEIARGMVKESLDALVGEDLALANKVRGDDEIVDRLNEQIFRELLTFMMEDPRTIHRALLIMQISKTLERISDHAKGMADMIVYMITGRNVRHETADTET